MTACASHCSFELILNLNVHQKFGDTCLHFIETEILAKRLFQVQLIQLHPSKGVVTLCAFNASLADFIRRVQNSQDKRPHVELLLEPTHRFPGILAPKIEITSKIYFEEWIHNQLSRIVPICLAQFTQSDAVKSKRKHIHQRKVCHSSHQPVQHIPPQVAADYSPTEKRVLTKQKSNIPKNGSNKNPKNNSLNIVHKRSELKKSSTPSGNKKSSLKQSLSCQKCEKESCQIESHCHVLTTTSAICQCDLCIHFDTVFHDLTVTNERQQRSCSVQTHQEGSPECKTFNVEQKPSLRDKEAFKLYSRSVTNFLDQVPKIRKDKIKSFNDDTCTKSECQIKRNSQFDFNPAYTPQWNRVNDMNKSSRYLFYSNLENFYRKLYENARENVLMSV